MAVPGQPRAWGSLSSFQEPGPAHQEWPPHCGQGEGCARPAGYMHMRAGACTRATSPPLPPVWPVCPGSVLSGWRAHLHKASEATPVVPLTLGDCPVILTLHVMKLDSAAHVPTALCAPALSGRHLGPYRVLGPQTQVFSGPLSWLLPPWALGQCPILSGPQFPPL